MQHAVTRVLGGVVLAVLTALTALTAASPASAAGQDLGWIRLQPASGTTDIAVLALTQKPCPGGDAIVATLRGPNIDPSNRLGNLVGVTEYKAFEPTISGQLWIPLSFTFQQWFAVNGVTMVPNEPYTISVVCRDLLRSSKTNGTFSGQVVFDGKGGYKALADASKPFDTQLKPKDPNGIPIPFPSGSGSASSAPTASSPSWTGSPSPSDSSSAPSPSASATSTGDATPSTQDPETAAAAPSTTPTSSGGSAPVLLGGLLALVAVGGAWTLYSRRRGGAGAPSDASTDTP